MRWVLLSLLAINVVLVFLNLDSANNPENREDAASLVGVTDTRLPVSEVDSGLSSGKSSGASSGISSGLSEKASGTESSVKGRRCSLVGPVENEKFGEKLIAVLAKYQIAAKKISDEIAIGPRFWVFIPPARTRSEALKTLRNLRQKKIDSFIITTKDLNNAVSLGIFDNIDSARNMIKIRKNQGYTVDMITRTRYQTQYWVLVESAPGPLKRHMAMSDMSETREIREIFCKTVDS